MANHKSAIKRIRQNERQHAVNSRNRAIVRTQVKKIEKALAESRLDDVKSMLPETLGAIDRSAQKGVMHRNTAGRLKSRLNARIKKAAAAPAA